MRSLQRSRLLPDIRSWELMQLIHDEFVAHLVSIISSFGLILN